MAEICFEDFIPGEVAQYGQRRIGKDEIIAFAKEFDPQTFHLDEEGAKATFAGGLIASGWHTNAIMNRMNCDFFLNRSACLGSPGVDEVKWLRPVRPGDTLGMRRTILEATPSRSKPDRGTVRFLYELFNQNEEVVCAHDCLVMFGRRYHGVAQAAAKVATSPAAGPAEGQSIVFNRSEGLPFFDDIPLGFTLELGDYRFDDDNVARFAQAFDNQGFHIDPAIAAVGPYGGIIASGWHTAASWMACMARNRAARMELALATGKPAARLGVSPGFRTMRFLKPVRPGDVLTYRSRAVEKRASASRPGWGLIFNDNSAHNQRGEAVLTFRGAVFWERRQP